MCPASCTRPAGSSGLYWGCHCSLCPIPLGSGCFCGKTQCDLPQSHTHWAQASLLWKAKFHTSIKTAGSKKYFNFLKTACVWLKCSILVIAIRCSCFAHTSSNGIGFSTGERDLMGLGKLGVDDNPSHEDSSHWESLLLGVSAYLVYLAFQAMCDWFVHSCIQKMFELLYMPESVLTIREYNHDQGRHGGSLCFSFSRSNREDRQCKGNCKWYLDQAP